MASSNLNWDCFGFGPQVLIESGPSPIIDFSFSIELVSISKDILVPVCTYIVVGTYVVVVLESILTFDLNGYS